MPANKRQANSLNKQTMEWKLTVSSVLVFRELAFRELVFRELAFRELAVFQ
jgi:hypothetical protein